MDSMGVSKNPVKQATTWLAEKTSRAKFSGATSGEPATGTFMAVETLTLGVEGKASLWKALKAVRERYARLASIDLDGLIERQDSARRARGRADRRGNPRLGG